MIDYYVELDISPSLGLDEIKEALVRLSKVYEKREADGFETAREKLVVINKAEAVFKTENARQRYDRELAESKNETTNSTDPMEERKTQYKQWYKKAVEYHKNGQYDTAKKAIDRVFRNVSPNDDDAQLYGLAADIYRQNGDLKGALDHVNEAIILDEKNAYYYITKFFIYEGLESSSFSDRANYDVHKQREILQTAEKLAKKDGDKKIIAQVYDLLAHAWYVDGRGDVGKAKKYAESAKKLMPNVVNATRVLEHIEQTRKENEKREQERLEVERQQELATQAANQQSELKYNTALANMKTASNSNDFNNLMFEFNRLGNYKDAEKLALKCNVTARIKKVEEYATEKETEEIPYHTGSMFAYEFEKFYKEIFQDIDFIEGITKNNDDFINVPEIVDTLRVRSKAACYAYLMNGLEVLRKDSKNFTQDALVSGELIADLSDFTKLFRMFGDYKEASKKATFCEKMNNNLGASQQSLYKTFERGRSNGFMGKSKKFEFSIVMVLPVITSILSALLFIHGRNTFPATFAPLWMLVGAGGFILGICWLVALLRD